MGTPFTNPDVRNAFDCFDDLTRESLLQLRELIFQVARETPQVGKIEETLKWGQPAYLTTAPKSGTSIRLGTPKTGGFAIYVPCQTSLITDFDAQFPGEFKIEGNRAVHFSAHSEVSKPQIRALIYEALTYHLK